MPEIAKKRPEFRNINLFRDLPTYRLPVAGIVVPVPLRTQLVRSARPVPKVIAPKVSVPAGAGVAVGIAAPAAMTKLADWVAPLAGISSSL